MIQQDDDGLLQCITPTLLRPTGKPETNLSTDAERQDYETIVGLLFKLAPRS
jgi:hypothetical protein